MRRNKKQQILIYIEHGQIWPEIKVCDSAQIEVIVVNNDRSAIWKPKILHDCDQEIEQVSQLSDELEEKISEVGQNLKR